MILSDLDSDLFLRNLGNTKYLNTIFLIFMVIDDIRSKFLQNNSSYKTLHQCYPIHRTLKPYQFK